MSTKGLNSKNIKAGWLRESVSALSTVINSSRNLDRSDIFWMNRCALLFSVAEMKGTLEVSIMYEGTVEVAESSKSIFHAGGCNLKGTQSPA